MLTAPRYAPVEPTKHDPTETEHDVQEIQPRPRTGSAYGAHAACQNNVIPEIADECGCAYCRP